MDEDEQEDAIHDEEDGEGDGTSPLIRHVVTINELVTTIVLVDVVGVSSIRLLEPHRLSSLISLLFSVVAAPILKGVSDVEVRQIIRTSTELRLEIKLETFVDPTKVTRIRH